MCVCVPLGEGAAWRAEKKICTQLLDIDEDPHVHFAICGLQETATVSPFIHTHYYSKKRVVIKTAFMHAP